MLKEAAERVRSINLNQLFDEVLDDQRYFILDLIRSQLSKGDGGGGALGTYSTSGLSQDYVDLKFDKGLFQGDSFPHYDLFFSGELYQSLVVQIKKDYIEIEFASSKLPLVEDATGMELNDSNVLTLNPVNLQLLIDRIKPLIQNRINGYLGI